jgi:hypothetical protein
MAAANAASISFLHIIYKSYGSGLTLGEGYFFYQTYKKTGSLLLVTIEQSFNGLWIFFTGLGIFFHEGERIIFHFR